VCFIAALRFESLRAAAVIHAMPARAGWFRSCWKRQEPGQHRARL